MSTVQKISLKNMGNFIYSVDNCDFSHSYLEDNVAPRLEGEFEKLDVIKSQAVGEIAKKIVSLIEKPNHVMVSREGNGMVTLEVYKVKRNYKIFLNTARYNEYKKLVSS